MAVASRGLVLLVDSKTRFRREAEEAFAGAGFDVVTAASSLEAIEYLGGLESLDLLATRARMPQGNPSGFGLGWIAKFGRPGLQILIHTESDDCLTAKEAANAPGQVLRKPGHGRELLEAAGLEFYRRAG